MACMLLDRHAHALQDRQVVSIRIPISLPFEAFPGKNRYGPIFKVIEVISSIFKLHRTTPPETETPEPRQPSTLG